MVPVQDNRIVYKNSVKPFTHKQGKSVTNMLPLFGPLLR